MVVLVTETLTDVICPQRARLIWGDPAAASVIPNQIAVATCNGHNGYFTNDYPLVF